MHMHVMNGDGFAKIELKDLKVIQNHMKPKDLKFALKITEEHKEEFERRWHEWFDQR